MTRGYEGSLEGRGLRIAVVVARFNLNISTRLLDGALECLIRHGIEEHDVMVAWVPGAFEIPMAAKRIAYSGEVDALVCVGAVIRGDTAHFDIVARESARGVAAAALETGVPITFGVLTAEDSGQASERAGGKHGNKGFEAAQAAIEMANLYSSLPKPQTKL